MTPAKNELTAGEPLSNAFLWCLEAPRGEVKCKFHRYLVNTQMPDLKPPAVLVLHMYLKSL